MSVEPREYCYRCDKVQPSKCVPIVGGHNWHCTVCGAIVDQDFDVDEEFEDDNGEPVGSCDECGTNIYPSEDDGSGLCDQCQWHAHHGSSGGNEVMG